MKKKNSFIENFRKISNKNINLPYWTQNRKDKRFILTAIFLSLSLTLLISTIIGVLIANSIRNKKMMIFPYLAKIIVSRTINSFGSIIEELFLILRKQDL